MSDVPNSVAGLSGVIETDTLCRHCGYNLRGLAATGLCPECGTAIALSLVGNLLKQADPDWLERLRFGTALKLWNILLGILVTGAAGTLVAAGLPQPLITIVGIAAGALGIWATFLITAQEPRISLREDPITLRKALRACVVVASIGAVISNVNVTGSRAFVAKVVVAIWELIGMFVAWGELLYFRRFALRIPDPELATSTTGLMWIAPLTGGLGIVVGLVVALSILSTPLASTAVVWTFLAGPCFFVAFGLCLLFWYVRLLIKYGEAFQSAASESRASVSPPLRPPMA